MPPKARWQSGHAAACKAVYAGSIPTLASTICDAPVAEWVDATDLKSVGRKALQVRVLPGAPKSRFGVYGKNSP